MFKHRIRFPHFHTPSLSCLLYDVQKNILTHISTIITMFIFLLVLVIATRSRLYKIFPRLIVNRPVGS